ncbi:MAG TPA: hypothetical protein VF297_07410 [Pyrinomonadaceae bacterium]
MKTEDLFKKLDTFGARLQEREAAKAAGEQTDPHVLALIERGMRAVRELDPIVRANCRDDPDALAQWDAIMRNYKELDEDWRRNQES